MKSFLKQIFAVVVGLGLVLFLCFLVVVAVSGDDKVNIDTNTLLVVDLSTPVSDRGRAPGFAEIAQGAVTPMALTKLLDGIYAAAEDERITGIFMHGAPGETGWASSREIRKALLDFRHHGKQIYAWFRDFDERTYYFGSTANNLWAAPFGSFSYDGFAAEISYYAKLLEKIGVQVQVSRVGKYKSAVEPFLLEEMSDANREQIANLLGDVFDVCLADSAAARGIEESQLREITETVGIIKVDEAASRGLIDEVLYFDQVLEKLNQISPDGDNFAQITLSSYVATLEAPEVDDSGGVVALVYAEGEIYDGKGDDGVAGDTIARALRELRQDEDVDAVVMRVNSPGGSAAASEFILREVELLRAAGKPVVVSMGDVAASGGYWISSRADHILVQPNTITGSIGVFGMFPEISGLLDLVGVNIETVKTGKVADAMSINRPLSTTELEIIQTFIDEIYVAFIERVASGRAMSPEAVREIAQGRVWSGRDAIEIGLADGFGSIDEAAEIAARLAGLENWSMRLPTVEEPGLLDVVLSSMLEESDDEGLAQLKQTLRVLDYIPRLGSRQGIYAMLPYNLVIK